MKKLFVSILTAAVLLSSMSQLCFAMDDDAVPPVPTDDPDVIDTCDYTDGPEDEN